MGVSTPATLIRKAILIGFLTVTLTAQKQQQPPRNPFSNGPGPDWTVEDSVNEDGKIIRLLAPSMPELRASRDPLRVDPARYHLELETEGMRVLRLTLGADEASLMHYSRDALVVCLSECHIRLTRPDGIFTDVHLEAGATRLLGSGMRSDKNLISKPVEMLLIERKDIADSK
jgi:hypothetical protein